MTTPAQPPASGDGGHSAVLGNLLSTSNAPGTAGDVPLSHSSNFTSNISSLSSTTDTLAAAAAGGPNNHVKFDPDAAQAVIKTWDQVIEELRKCVADANQAFRLSDPPAHDGASIDMMSKVSDSFTNYKNHAADLLKAAVGEQQKLQDAVKAYQQNDSNAAHTAKHVQGNA